MNHTEILSCFCFVHGNFVNSYGEDTEKEVTPFRDSATILKEGIQKNTFLGVFPKLLDSWGQKSKNCLWKYKVSYFDVYMAYFTIENVSYLCAKKNC